MLARIGRRLAASLRAVFAAALALAALAAAAGTLDRAALEAMFPPPFVVGDKPAELPAWPVFRRLGASLELQAHVFETADLEPVAGYGGKPLNLLVVMDRDGSFRDVRLLSHAEPIFRSAKGNAVLGEFATQYVGLSVNHSIQVLGAKARREQTETHATLHGVVAGTVTTTAIDRSILESAAQVAQARLRAAGGAAGVPAARPPDGPNDRYRRSGWNALAAARLLQPLRLTNREVQAAFRDSPAADRDTIARIRPDDAAVDLWIAIASLPQAGRNLLDPAGWLAVRAARESGTPVLLVVDGGRYPLAGRADRPRRTRLALRQDGRAFALEPFEAPFALALSGHRSGVAADSVPRLFAVRPAADGARLDIARPMELDLAVQRDTDAGPELPATVSFRRHFEIPGAAEYLPVRETPAWLLPWQQRAGDLAGLGAGLVLLVVVLARPGGVVGSQRRLNLFRTAYLVFTLGFVGWWAQAQLTVFSITAGVEAARAGRSLGFLLADPLAVVLWAFTGVTLLVWGRGTFCGWLCPFGALQELVAKAAAALGIRHRHLRPALDRRLKWIKYGVLAALLGAAALAPAWTEAGLEVEPFKTAISLYFVREGPYVAWALACVAAGVLVYRGYCRYLCPLGAALATLATARRWAWIPRRPECGTPCQTCRHRCEYQAIPASGRVDYAECFQCLDCVAIHRDDHRCLPLVLERRHRVIRVRPAGAHA